MYIFSMLECSFPDEKKEKKVILISSIIKKIKIVRDKFLALNRRKYRCNDL
jgi:hypothetical protein